MTAVSPSLSPGSDDVAVRTAERADLLDVVRIERSVFPQPWPFSAFERFLGEAGFLVAVDSGVQAVLGYVVADTTPNYGRDIGHVKDLAVHPDARRRGLGRLLLRRALFTVVSQGAALVKLEVRDGNDSARALYRSEGFEPLRRHPRYYADGDDALVMVLDADDWQASVWGREESNGQHTGDGRDT